MGPVAALGTVKQANAVAAASEAAASAPPAQATVTIKPDTTVADGTFTPDPMGRGGYTLTTPGSKIYVSAEDNTNVTRPIVADGILNGTNP
jgi:hypothetical protein